MTISGTHLMPNPRPKKATVFCVHATDKPGRKMGAKPVLFGRKLSFLFGFGTLWNTIEATLSTASRCAADRKKSVAGADTGTVPIAAAHEARSQIARNVLRGVRDVPQGFGVHRREGPVSPCVVA